MNVEPNRLSPGQAVPNLTEAELDTLAMRLTEVLQGTPLAQALHVLTTRTPQLLCDGHVVPVATAKLLAVKTVLGEGFTAPLPKLPEPSADRATSMALSAFDPDAYGPWEAGVCRRHQAYPVAA